MNNKTRKKNEKKRVKKHFINYFYFISFFCLSTIFVSLLNFCCSHEENHHKLKNKKNKNFVKNLNTSQDSNFTFFLLLFTDPFNLLSMLSHFLTTWEENRKNSDVTSWGNDEGNSILFSHSFKWLCKISQGNCWMLTSKKILIFFIDQSPIHIFLIFCISWVKKSWLCMNKSQF